MTALEVDSIARFALVALVILPLLPVRNLGPYDAWNPRQIWMVVVVVLGLSFAGYVATRRLGSGKGIMITALCGSLASSTAVTVTYAQRLRQKDGPEAPLIAGIALASLVMFVRVQLLSITLIPYAARSLALAMVPARSEEHTSELQSLMRISYAVFCLKKKNRVTQNLTLYIL